MIIGKTTPIAQDDAQGQNARYTRHDHSTCLRHSESGMVDQVQCYAYTGIATLNGGFVLINLADLLGQFLLCLRYNHTSVCRVCYSPFLSNCLSFAPLYVFVLFDRFS